MKCLWAGNIGCPVCRSIPHNYDFEEVEDAITDATSEHKEATMNRLYRRGLQDYKSGKNTSPQLKRAIEVLEKYKLKQLKDKEEAARVKKATSEYKMRLKKAADDMKAKIAKKYNFPKTKLPCNRFRVKSKKSSWRCYAGIPRYYKLKIASVMGYRD